MNINQCIEWLEDRIETNKYSYELHSDETRSPFPKSVREQYLKDVCIEQEYLKSIKELLENQCCDRKQMCQWFKNMREKKRK